MSRRRPAVGVCAAAALLGAAGGAARAELDLHAALAAAEPGAEIVIPAGVYPGPLLLDRPVTLSGAGDAIIDGGGRGDVIRVTAPDVTIRGLVIRNTGDSLDREHAGVTVLAPRARILDSTFENVLFGIYLKQAGGSVIRDNRIGGMDLAVARRGDGIRLWYSPDSVIEGNVVHRSRDVVMWFSERVTLRDNEITDGRYGLHFMYSHSNVLEGNRLRGNSVGAFLMYSRDLVLRGNILAHNRGPSGYGVGLKDMDGLTATGNLFIGNRIGVYLDNSPASVKLHHDFSNNVLAYNDIGLAFQPSVRRNRVHDNAFIENHEQVAMLGRGASGGNEFTVGGRGNFWSDYRGYDLDDDGIGDLPYRAESLFENLMDREPKLRMFLYSPAQQAIEFASRAFPAVRPEPKLEDTRPLTRPVALRVTAATTPSRGGMLGLSALLLGFVTLAVVFVHRPRGTSRTPLDRARRSTGDGP